LEDRKTVSARCTIRKLIAFSATILDLISTIMIQCDTLSYSSYYNIIIASNIFYGLGTWGLFFVVTYQLNKMLREQHGGSNMVFKVVPLVIVAVMFAITAGHLGLSSYNVWSETDAGYNAGGSWIYGVQEKLQLAKSILQLSGLIASGALCMMTIFAMRSRSLPGGVCSPYIPPKRSLAKHVSGSHRLGGRSLHLHGDLDASIRRLRCPIPQQ
jgi:hypothetical protein